jgi:DNA-binding transcriptional ArsR family regulator
VAFTIAQLLLENGQMSPSQIARAVGRSLSRLSHTLAALRLADVVRYDSDTNMRARYRLKHPREIRQVIRAPFQLREFGLLPGVMVAELRNCAPYHGLI